MENKKETPPQEGQKDAGPLGNLEPNVSAAFSYLIPPFTGIVFYLLEKENKFVRFHAFQSVLFGIIIYVLTSMARFLTNFYVGFILGPIISVGAGLLWLFLMWKAYNKEEYELPYIGSIAKDQIYKRE